MEPKKTYPIINTESGHTNRKREYISQEIKSFPKSIQDLYKELPTDVREKIFPSEKDMEGERQFKTTLRDIIERIGEKEREELMFGYLSELFLVGKYREYFADAYRNNKLREEVKRLMDILWENRIKKEEDLATCLNEKRYNELLKERQRIVDKIKKTENELQELKKRPLKSGKGKGAQRIKDKENEIEEIKKELDEFDSFNNNTRIDIINGKGIAGRQKRERMWTRGVVTMNMFMDPTDFAILMDDRFSVMLSTEKRVMKRYKESSDVVEVRRYKRAKQIIQEVDKAIQEWSDEHAGESRLISEQEGNRLQKKALIIKHLHSHFVDYKKGKERGESDEEMVYSIRQMEIMLTLLKRISTGEKK